MTIDVATGIGHILKQESVSWISTLPICRVNNPLGQEGAPMPMMRDDRHTVAVADAFSSITGGSRIGMCPFQWDVNSVDMQCAYAGLAHAYEDGSPAGYRAYTTLILLPVPGLRPAGWIERGVKRCQS